MIAQQVTRLGEPGAEALYRTGDPLFMTSLARGLHVIRVFSCLGQRLRVAEVSRASGLNRAVVRRCLYTLCELGGRQFS